MKKRADEMAKKVRKLTETIRLNIFPPVLASKSHNKSARSLGRFRVISVLDTPHTRPRVLFDMAMPHFDTCVPESFSLHSGS